MSRFNQVVRWIGTLICSEPNSKERRKVIAYFIIIAVVRPDASVVYFVHHSYSPVCELPSPFISVSPVEIPCTSELSRYDASVCGSDTVSGLAFEGVLGGM